jgi:hypothetical protein
MAAVVWQIGMATAVILWISFKGILWAQQVKQRQKIAELEERIRKLESSTDDEAFSIMDQLIAED